MQFIALTQGRLTILIIVVVVIVVVITKLNTNTTLVVGNIYVSDDAARMTIAASHNKVLPNGRYNGSYVSIEDS
jgi:hypothetical protein